MGVAQVISYRVSHLIFLLTWTSWELISDVSLGCWLGCYVAAWRWWCEGMCWICTQVTVALLSCAITIAHVQCSSLACSLTGNQMFLLFSLFLLPPWGSKQQAYPVAAGSRRRGLGVGHGWRPWWQALWRDLWRADCRESTAASTERGWGTLVRGAGWEGGVWAWSSRCI